MRPLDSITVVNGKVLFIHPCPNQDLGYIEFKTSGEGKITNSNVYSYFAHKVPFKINL